MTWTWETLDGHESMNQDDLVRLDDGSEGFVEHIRISKPRVDILVTRRKIGRMKLRDKWVQPCNIVG